jgi:DNA-binding FrmR family transcriptional regulator
MATMGFTPESNGFCVVHPLDERMKTTPVSTERRNQRITARLRRIQGQITAIERSLSKDPDGAILLQRVAAGRGAMSSLMSYLIEDKLRTLPLADDGDGDDVIEDMIEIVHGSMD